METGGAAGCVRSQSTAQAGCRALHFVRTRGAGVGDGQHFLQLQGTEQDGSGPAQGRAMSAVVLDFSSAMAARLDGGPYAPEGPRLPLRVVEQAVVARVQASRDGQTGANLYQVLSRLVVQVEKR